MRDLSQSNLVTAGSWRGAIGGSGGGGRSTGGAADLRDGKVEEVGDGFPLVFRNLDIDGILEATFLIVGGELAVGGGIERTRDIGETDAELLGFFPVNLPLDFGTRVLDRHVHAFQVGDGL